MSNSTRNFVTLVRSALLPVSINNLAVFISYPSARKFASSKISTNVSALSYVHKLGNFPDPTKNFLVQKLLSAHSKLHSSPDVRLPITRSVLQHLVLALNNTNSSAFQTLLYQTMFLVTFYGFFRVGELTAKSANFQPLLQIRDLHFHFKSLNAQKYRAKGGHGQNLTLLCFELIERF